MKKSNTQKRIKAAIAGMAALAIIAGSLAYWNQTHTIDNPFETGGKHGSSTIEDFTPDKDWQPGVEVDKTVKVQNTGEHDIIIRVKMDEKWVRKGETTPYKQFAANPNGAVYEIEQASQTDGLTDADKSVVIKHFSTSANWVDGGDGWFYYKTNLAPKSTSDTWLESVELLNDLDVGSYKTVNYVTVDEVIDENTTWIEYNKADGMPKVIGDDPVLHSKAEVVYNKDGDGEELIGYLNSDYTLTLTTQTVQATKEAVLATFDLTSEQLSGLAVTWDFAD